MIIKSRNTLADEAIKTYITNPEVAGTNVLRWKNPNGFAASWAVQVGKTGAEQSEIVLLSTSTPSGTAGTLTANDLYEHPTDTPLYAIKYDQVVFERSTTGTSGTATPMTGGTITIQADSPFTIFDDTTGSVSYAYRTYFRSSVLAVTTTESSWITSSGFTFYSLGKLRQRVKDKFFDASFIPNDLMIDDWINEWLQIMNNAMVDINEDYGIGTVGVSFGVNVEIGTITSTDFRGQIKRVWLSDSTGTFVATKMDSASFIPTKTFTTSYPYYYMQGDTVIGRKPIDNSGTAIIEYPLNQPVLVEDTDQIPTPMQNYTSGFVDWAYAQGLRKDNKSDVAGEIEQKATAILQRFKTDMAPRLRSGVTYIDIVEDTGADQDIWL